MFRRNRNDSMLCNHLVSGILERSKTVPTVTLNGLRQSLHFHWPGRVLI